MNKYKVNIPPIFIHKGRKNNLKIMANMQSGKLANNFYEVLSLHSTNVGFEEIKKAYRCKALQYHPDICRDLNKEESTIRFIELRKAYETLYDPISRQIYDYELNLMNSFESDQLMWKKSKGNRKIVFHKDMWKRQLEELKRRSCNRMKKKE